MAVVAMEIVGEIDDDERESKRGDEKRVVIYFEGTTRDLSLVIRVKGTVSTNNRI